MLQQALMFLAVDTPPAQAVPALPPARALPERAVRKIPWRQVVNTAANAAGFAGLLAVLWYFLWLMQAVVPTTVY